MSAPCDFEVHVAGTRRFPGALPAICQMPFVTFRTSARTRSFSRTSFRAIAGSSDTRQVETRRMLSRTLREAP